MFAFGLALVKLGLDVQVTHLIDHNYWPNEPARAPMIHLTSAMILTARGPEQQAQGVTNTLAYINVALALGAVGKPQSGLARYRPGQRTGRPRARPEGGSASRVPADRNPPIAITWRRSGESGAEIPHAGKSAFELLDALGREIHALLVMGSNPVVSAPDALRSGGGWRAQHAGRRRLLPVGDRRARRHRVARGAMGRGSGDNDEPRRAGHSQAPRHRSASRGPHRHRDPVGHRGGAGPRPLVSTGDEARRLRRAEACHRWRDRRLRRDHLRADRRGRRGVLALPDCREPGHAATIPRPIPDAVRPRAFSRDAHAGIADGATRVPLLLTTGRVLAQYQSGTQTRRTPECRRIAPNPSRRSIR